MIAAETAGVRPLRRGAAKSPGAGFDPRPAAPCRAGCGAGGPAPRTGGDPVLVLHRTVGNRAVGRLLRPPATTPSPGLLARGAGAGAGAAITLPRMGPAWAQEERTPRPPGRGAVEKTGRGRMEPVPEPVVDGRLPRPFGEEEEAGAERREPVQGGRPLPYREAVEAVERARFFRNSPIVRVEPQVPAATVDNTRTSAQITALARAASGRTSGADNAGLTRARLGMRMSPSTRAGPPSGGSTPFWITDLSVTPLYHSITVFIASEYAPGSCEHRVTLAHENEHVRVDGELLREYAGRMRAALVFADLPTAENPLSAASAAEGEQAVETLLRGILTPVYDELRLRLREANGALDTPASYRLVHAQCTGW